MTGIYVRIKRQEGWVIEEIEELSDQELKNFLKDKTPEWHMNLTLNLLDTFRRNEVD